MKVLLLHGERRMRLPARDTHGRIANPELHDQVLICYQVCDERRKPITAPGGRSGEGGRYIEHPEEAAMREKLQRAVGKQGGIASYPMGDGTVRFEAIRSFRCELEIEVSDDAL